jgi:hypothetical protein
MRSSLLLTVILAVQVSAWGSDDCTTTKEFRDAKLEAFRAVREPYERCVSSMSEAYYWRAVTKCVADGKGENVGGGCSHLVGNGSYPVEPYDVSHCEVLRSDKADFEDYLEYLIRMRGIKRCNT